MREARQTQIQKCVPKKSRTRESFQIYSLQHKWGKANKQSVELIAYPKIIFDSRG